MVLLERGVIKDVHQYVQPCHENDLTKALTCSKCKAESRLPSRNCTCSDKKCLSFMPAWEGLERSCNECEKGTGWFLYHGTCCPCLNCEGGVEQCSPNGVCLQGCKPGFYPKSEGCHLVCDIPNCTWCEPFHGFSDAKVCVGCDDGYYPEGGGCKKCSENCKGGSCNNKTGDCLDGCVAGAFGSRCDAHCDKNVCAECDANAQVCLKCKDGFWGTQCSNKCPEKCNKCDKVSGSCLICERKYFGANCSETCGKCLADACDIKGDCELGCKTGHYGPDCGKKCMDGCQICEDSSSCIQCIPGLKYRFGECAGQCVYCLDQKCNSESICQTGCVEGRFGQKCDQKCIDGCKLCHNSHICHTCKAGYRLKDDKCQPTCENCINGSCISNGTCSQGCIIEWFGEKCDQKCKEGCKTCTSVNDCTRM